MNNMDWIPIFLNNPHTDKPGSAEGRVLDNLIFRHVEEVWWGGEGA